MASTPANKRRRECLSPTLPDETANLSKKVDAALSKATEAINSADFGSAWNRQDKGKHLHTTLMSLIEVITLLTSAVAEDQVRVNERLDDNDKRYQRDIQPGLDAAKTSKITQGMKDVIQKAKQATNSIRISTEYDLPTSVTAPNERLSAILKANKCKSDDEHPEVTPKRVTKVNINKVGNQHGSGQEKMLKTYIVDCNNSNDRDALLKQIRSAETKIIARQQVPRYLHSFMTSLRKKLLELEGFRGKAVWVRLNRTCDRILILRRDLQSTKWELVKTTHIPYPKSLVSEKVTQQCKLGLLTREALEECIPADY